MNTADSTLEVNLDPAANDYPSIDVPKPLSEQQVRFYVENGFLAVPNVITRGEIDALIADTVKLLRGGYASSKLPPLEENLSDEQVMKSFLGLLQPHHVSPVMRDFVKHPKICGMLSQIVAAHVPYWDGSVKGMQSMVFTKPPGYPGQAWHQDEYYIPTRDRSLAGAWIALDDATVENGCLYVIPQTHRSGFLYPQRPHTRPGEWDFAPESYGFDDSVAVPVEVKAGDVIFFHGYIIHGSYQNRSDIYRRAVVNHYCNAWSLLPWQNKVDNRSVVPVAGIDPYVWKGYDEFSPDNVRVRPVDQPDEPEPQNG